MRAARCVRDCGWLGGSRFFHAQFAEARTKRLVLCVEPFTFLDDAVRNTLLHLVMVPAEHELFGCHPVRLLEKPVSEREPVGDRFYMIDYFAHQMPETI
jgi:hypothetical protein